MVNNKIDGGGMGDRFKEWWRKKSKPPTSQMGHMDYIEDIFSNLIKNKISIYHLTKYKNGEQVEQGEEARDLNANFGFYIYNYFIEQLLSNNLKGVISGETTYDIITKIEMLVKIIQDIDEIEIADLTKNPIQLPMIKDFKLKYGFRHDDNKLYYIYNSHRKVELVKEKERQKKILEPTIRKETVTEGRHKGTTSEHEEYPYTITKISDDKICYIIRDYFFISASEIQDNINIMLKNIIVRKYQENQNAPYLEKIEISMGNSLGYYIKDIIYFIKKDWKKFQNNQKFDIKLHVKMMRNHGNSERHHYMFIKKTFGAEPELDNKYGSIYSSSSLEIENNHPDGKFLYLFIYTKYYQLLKQKTQIDGGKINKKPPKTPAKTPAKKPAKTPDKTPAKTPAKTTAKKPAKK